MVLLACHAQPRNVVITVALQGTRAYCLAPLQAGKAQEEAELKMGAQACPGTGEARTAGIKQVYAVSHLVGHSRLHLALPLAHDFSGLVCCAVYCRAAVPLALERLLQRAQTVGGLLAQVVGAVHRLLAELGCLSLSPKALLLGRVHAARYKQVVHLVAF